MDETPQVDLTVKAVIEALLFGTQKPLTPKEIGAYLRTVAEETERQQGGPPVLAKEPEIQAALQSLAREYRELDRSFQLVEQASGWQLTTLPAFAPWVRQLFPDLRATRLSAPALETLAIIAYRQPVTKADVESIRGVTVDGVLQKLLDAGLVRIGGRADVPGRALLYETTLHFLEHFGLKSLEELPNASELRSLAPPVPPAAPASVGTENGKQNEDLPALGSAPKEQG